MAEKPILGYHGRLLRIDLTRQTHTSESISPDDFRLYMGGRGLGAAMLLRELPAGVEPLSEENLLIFSTGPLVGTPVPGSDRYSLHTKSPQTGLYCFSISGGRFGSLMKKTGYDVVIISGKCSGPTYLLIDDKGSVEFKNAEHLWGKDTELTQETIHSEINPNVGVTCIGPAGENMVPFACLLNERRALGRGGAGAVMGFKNLKAIVVRGNKKAPLADSKKLKAAIRTGMANIRSTPLLSEVFRMYGSASTLSKLKDNGVLPDRNWSDVAIEEAEAITAERMRKHFLIEDIACSTGCPVKCSKMFGVKDGDWEGALSEGPDYETVYSFGSCCGVYDLAPIIHADSICDMLGMDTISAGVSIAFAMECLEKGIIDADEYNIKELAFGNPKAMIGLLEDIAFKRNFGAVVGMGTKRMAEKFGKGSEKFAMHAKGMELGGYDARGLKGMSLVYGCGPRGGCHHSGGYTVIPEIMNPKIDRFAEKGKAPLAANTRNRRASVCDSGLICAFVAIGLTDETVVDMLKGACGFDYKPEELMVIGDRISQLERAFNFREGLTRDDDALPQRLLEEIIKKGPSQGHKIDDFESMKDEFYQVCGWDQKTGAPLPERLKALNIEWVKDYITR